MKKMLYITYIDFGKDCSSGSTMRPQMMYRAFEEAGLQVKLLSGSQAKENRAQRRANVEEINRWLDNNRPDYCYIEPNVYPIMNGFDVRLIRRVHKMGVPVAYFFRDAFYKLGKEFLSPPPGFVRRMKNAGLNLLHARDERMLGRCADIIYFPTQTMADYFSFADRRTLPPAGENRLPETPLSSVRTNTGIYVGGISKAYGIEILLGAYEMLNQGEDCGKYPLLLVCRQAELNQIPQRYREAPWMEIHHASGAELEPLYRRADIALIPRIQSQYNELCLSIKLFEYMGYGLPVVLSDSKEMSLQVKKAGSGVIVGNTAGDFAQGVKKLLGDPALYRQCCANQRQALLAENLWLHRAQQVVRELDEKMKG
ncbi:MAG TPA: glycosyltransferase [Candidatus Gallacutalibacter stercoravium]|nr:glycosyltransferase [Candidatus Gallacutalibacter stercoravium]